MILHPLSPTLRRGGLLTLLALHLLAFAGPSRADEAEAPRFHIERIIVEGARRAKPELVISETRLQTDSEYSETELRRAIYRINRLPFILEARLAMRKGSERGRYVLVITVKETRSLFMASNLIYQGFGEPLGQEATNGELEASQLAGWRGFIGTSGVVFASVSEGGGVQAGYTQYNLFDRRVFFSLGLSRNGCCPATIFPIGLDPTFSSWSTRSATEASATLGVPLALGGALAGNQSLRLRYSQLIGRPATDNVRQQVLGGTADSLFEHQDLLGRSLELAWLRDTTDDPLFPTRGVELEAGLEVSLLQANILQRPLIQGPIDGPSTDGRREGFDTRSLNLFFAANQHWPLGRGNSGSLGARFALGQSHLEEIAFVGVRDRDMDWFEATLSARFSRNLWNPSRARRWGDLRWETTALYTYSRTNPGFGLPNNPLEEASASTSLVLRNPWGVFRFGVTFTTFKGVLG